MTEKTIEVDFKEISRFKVEEFIEFLRDRKFHCANCGPKSKTTLRVDVSQSSGDKEEKQYCSIHRTLRIKDNKGEGYTTPKGVISYVFVCSHCGLLHFIACEAVILWKRENERK
jgi:hypothetical protein